MGNSNLTSVVKFDTFHCMSESSTLEYRIVFLHRFCNFHQLDVSDSFLRRFASCMEFTEDSLSFNFFNHFRFPREKEFLSFFVKILHFFNDYELKTFSLFFLTCCSLGKAEIMKLIESNGESLVTLELFHTWLQDDNEIEPDITAFLPNLERLLLAWEIDFSISEYLVFGSKLTWLEKSLDTVFPIVDGVEFYLEQQSEISTKAENLLEFLKALPNLECLILDDEFEPTDELKRAFKSLSRLKKIDFKVKDRIENYIDSKVVETLHFQQASSSLVNWNFISSLERLKRLVVSNDFKP